MPVYFIQSENKTGPVKIGWSKNVNSRLAVLNMDRPPGSESLVVLKTIDCTRDYEFRIHDHLKRSRVFGEWFLPTKEVLSFIENPDVDILSELVILNTRINRESYNELLKYTNEERIPVSSVASFIIELGLRVMRQFDGNVQAVVDDINKMLAANGHID